eukprot:12994-Eustigmatos_ZCMA.PRE.1
MESMRVCVVVNVMDVYRWKQYRTSAPANVHHFSKCTQRPWRPMRRGLHRLESCSSVGRDMKRSQMRVALSLVFKT